MKDKIESISYARIGRQIGGDINGIQDSNLTEVTGLG